jgi:hypothetical protein
MARWNLLFAFGLCLLMSALGFPGATVLSAADGAAGKAPKAVIKTKFGDMEIVFFP